MTWQHDLDTAWDSLGDTDPQQFFATISRIVDDPDVPADVRKFQLACARDSTGRSDLAVPLYRHALELGLTGYERRRATIQLASSLRNLGQPEESVRLLAAERTDDGDGLDDAVVVFHALALADLGRDRAAIAALVHALAEHLPRYTASAHRYAALLKTGGEHDHTEPQPTQKRERDDDEPEMA